MTPQPLHEEEAQTPVEQALEQPSTPHQEGSTPCNLVLESKETSLSPRHSVKGSYDTYDSYTESYSDSYSYETSEDEYSSSSGENKHTTQHVTLSNTY